MDEDVVVPADWLADNLGGVRLVDVRDAWEYEGIGHIPGAVSLPFDEFRTSASRGDAENANSAEQSSADSRAAESPETVLPSRDDGNRDAVSEPPRDDGETVSESGDEGMLPGEERWADLLGGLGIGADDTVVAYDDMHGVFAARFVVTAMVYGHERLHLLDGDYSSWMQAHETTNEMLEVEPTTYEIRDAETPLVDADTVAAAVDDPDAVLVDTRSPEEFGDGHIEGAVNLDWREVVDDETRGLRPKEEVETLLADRGVTREKRVVLYCNTARRISHTYIVLQWLGFPRVEFYEGSLTEWKAEGRPLADG